MSFLAILRKDLNVFVRCVNYQVLHGSKMKDSQTRCVTSFVSRSYSDEHIPFQRPLSDKTVSRLRQFDGVSKDFELIYRAPRSFYFSMAHITVLISGVSFPVFVYLIAEKNNFTYPIKLADRLVLYGPVNFYMALGFITFILGALFKIISRFPLRLYRRKSSDEYIAAYANFLLPWKMTQFKFKKGDTILYEAPNYIPFQVSNFKIKGHKNILFEEHFLRPSELEYMMAAKP